VRGSEPGSSAGGELINEFKDWLRAGATSDPTVIAYLRTAHADLDLE
jgi:hypothetical protein